MSVSRAHRRRYLGLLSAGAALSALALSPVLTGTAQAASPPAPAFASVSEATGDVVTSPVGGPAKPAVITTSGASVTVTVSLWTSSAKTTPAAFNKDTDFTGFCPHHGASDLHKIVGINQLVFDEVVNGFIHIIDA